MAGNNRPSPKKLTDSIAIPDSTTEGIVRSNRGKRFGNKKELVTALGFLLPNLLGFLAFTLLPVLLSFGMAFTNWSLKPAVALHFAYYNFVRTHGTLKMTPAMMAGVERSFLTVGDLVEAAQ